MEMDWRNEAYMALGKAYTLLKAHQNEDKEAAKALKLTIAAMDVLDGDDEPGLDYDAYPQAYDDREAELYYDPYADEFVDPKLT